MAGAAKLYIFIIYIHRFVFYGAFPKLPKNICNFYNSLLRLSFYEKIASGIQNMIH